MTESVSVLQTSFGVDQLERNRGQGHHDGMNLNSNANHANVQAKHSVTIDHDSCSKVAIPKRSRPAMTCSDETIYDAAVERRTSSSSEDADKQDTSGETVEIDFDKLNVPVFSDGTVVLQVRRHDEPHPSTSHNTTCHRDRQEQCYQPRHDRTPEPTPDERADRIVKDTELAHARVFPITGNDQVMNPSGGLRMAQIDKSYITVGGHVDEILYQKIKKGEYVDFSKLVPHYRVAIEDEQRLEMVIKGGQTFYVPVNNCPAINSFVRWEQAFRVYANIYIKENPHRSSELIEYNHVIHTISSSYSWENVYQYDKDFRIHMSCNPEPSLSIILQQAWSLYLKDKINHSDVHTPTGTSHDRVNEPCRRYNQSGCSFRASCKYDHKCSYCFKFGHSILTSRKLIADRERNKSTGGHQQHGRQDMTHHSPSNGHRGGSDGQHHHTQK